MNNQTWAEHPLVSAYLERVCVQVKAKKVHDEVRMELISHLDELVEEKMSEGHSEKEAVKQALISLGDAAEVGKQLHSAHKPLMEWGLLGIVAALIGVGLMAMYAMDLALIGRNAGGWFVKKSFFIFLGILLMITFYYVDFRRLCSYSWYLYAFALLMFVVCQFMGTEINGGRTWLSAGAYTINVYHFNVYALLIAFAGCISSMTNYTLTRGQLFVTGAKFTVAFILIPCWLYTSQNQFLSLFVYIAGLIVVLLVLRKIWMMLGIVIILAGFGGVFMLVGSYKTIFILERINVLLQFKKNPETTGYYWGVIMDNLQSAGLWGQGFGISNDQLRYIYSDFIFSYLIYSMGWVFGSFLLLLTITFVYKIAALVWKLNDSFAKAVTAGICPIFAFHSLWNILMSLGYVPILGVPFPFVSYGNLSSMLELASVGLLLGLYRRKNMLGAGDVASQKQSYLSKS